MKRLEFVGSSLEDLKEFPTEARRAAGFELGFVQRGLNPSDWKPMKEVGAGVQEIRIHALGVACTLCCQVCGGYIRAACVPEEDTEDQKRRH